MEVLLRFCEVVFKIKVDREVIIDEGLESFLLEESNTVHVTADFKWEWNEMSEEKGTYLGKDLLLEYYSKNDKHSAYVIASNNTYQGKTEYSSDFKEMHCYLNKEICRPELMNIGTLLRFLPMREIFNYYKILFFHAAQVLYKEKGIIFTAASGTGKTTQSKLWKKYREAELLCNDRTLIRKMNDTWMTYGFPMDGSEPVRSNKKTNLGCIVVLEQGKQNKIERLWGAKALTSLMSNLVLDAWDSDARFRAVNQLIRMMETIPVYRYACTMDEDAVHCLENQLKEDGVIKDEKNS